MSIIDNKKVLTDSSGAPLNPKDRKEVQDMSAAAIERRENIQITKEQMQAAMDAYIKQMNPYLVGHAPQLMSQALPLHNFVLCKPHIIAEQTDKGIVLAESERAKQQDVVNDAIGYTAVLTGPEVVNCKPGDKVFQAYPNRPMTLPLIDDINGETEVREYHCFPENWIYLVLREGADQNDVKPSPMPEHEKQSAGE